MIKRQPTFCQNEAGFTLIELLIAMALTLIVSTAMYNVYAVSIHSNVVQKEVVEAQNNLRAAISLLSRELKMAGFNPTKTEVNSDGIDNDADGSTDEDDGSEEIGFQSPTDETSLHLTMDKNGDGDIADQNEDILYTLSDNNLLRNNEIIAENILDIEFYYNDSTTSPTSLTTISNVRVSILAETAHTDSNYSGNQTFTTPSGAVWSTATGYRGRYSSFLVNCRNLAL